MLSFKKLDGIIGLHIAVFLFGLSSLFAKIIVISPYLIVIGRTLFGGITIVLVSLCMRRSFKVKSKSDGIILVISGAILTLHWWSFFYSIQISSVAIGLLTFSTFPLFITLMEPYFFNEKMRGVDLITAIFVFAGLILVIPSFELSNNVTIGVIWGTFSGFTFAILALFNRNLIKKYSALIIAGYQNGVATIVLLPFTFSTFFSLNLNEYFLLAFLGVFCTALAQALFINSLQHIKVQLASIITTLEPVYGILLAIIFLKEIPSNRTMLGGLIILGTIIIAMYKKKSNQSIIN